ncbi:amino acid ABC transporter permease [Ruicaihuangia caeni]|uniref:Amino acid ABC transporter permease n=1 Tax=Ruicaihuangia caeni TaxID=3042517 RepID=A0AAW6T6L8_9MICO|nr:amino acid ABC transporter permease [Klugiella sp. YN-L-19]MDI2099427.1 amino acid ABC transporter permease [Klugiella sp. YN-L-19]
MIARTVGFEWDAFGSSFAPLLEGAVMTVVLTVVVMLLSVPIGVGLALLRLSRHKVVRAIATGWVEVWRATPVLLQLFWVFYVLPALTGITLSPFLVAIVAFTGHVSAFLSETFRAGIASIRPQQRQAALSLGMTPAQSFIVVVGPQAWWRILPAFANTWVSLFKDTALVSTIAVADISYIGLQLRQETFMTLEVLTAMALMYLALGYPQAKLADWLERRFGVKE